MPTHVFREAIAACFTLVVLVAGAAPIYAGGNSSLAGRGYSVQMPAAVSEPNSTIGLLAGLLALVLVRARVRTVTSDSPG